MPRCFSLKRRGLRLKRKRIRAKISAILCFQGLESMALMSLPVGANAEERLPAPRILEQYESSLRRLERMACEYSRRTYDEGGAFPNEIWRFTKEGALIRVGGGWKHKEREIGRAYLERLYPQFYSEQEQLFVRGNYSNVYHRYKPASITPEAQKFPSTLPELGKVYMDAEFEATSDKRRWGYHRTTGLHELFGYIQYDDWRPLVEIMREAGVTLREDAVEIDERAAVVLASRGPYGHHQLWLTADEPRLPLRIRVEKQGEDLWEGKPLASQPPDNPKYERPSLPMRGCIYEMKDVSIAPIDGVPMVTGYTLLTTRIYSGGARFRRREEIRITNIRVDPDPSELEMTSVPPNGTEVLVHNARAIDFEWRDGAIHKVIDGSVVGGLDDLEFRAGRLGISTWLIVGNALVIAAIVGVVIYRRASERRKRIGADAEKDLL